MIEDLKKPDVTVAVCVRNMENHISDCIVSILNQSFVNFELIIIDDKSSDNTTNLIKNFNDKRIRFYKNEYWLGASKSRNLCLSYSKCDYIFFTDADCKVTKLWLEEGLKYLKTSSFVGVEGKTIYVSEEYKPTRSDAIMENKFGNEFLTCNICYKKNILETIGGFDGRFVYQEDRDIGLRAIKKGKIFFNPKMVVYHQKRILNPKQIMHLGRRLRDRVLLYKKYGDKPRTLFFGRIVYPLNLVVLLFPPLMFVSLFKNNYKSKEDFKLFPFLFLRIIYERLSFWDMCVRERVFFI